MVRFAYGPPPPVRKLDLVFLTYGSPTVSKRRTASEKTLFVSQKTHPLGGFKKALRPFSAELPKPNSDSQLFGVIWFRFWASIRL